MRLAVALSLLLLSAAHLPAAPPRITGVKAVPRSILKLERDYVAPIDTPDAEIKEGVIVDLLLLSGKTYEGLEITGIQTAKEPGTFRGLTFKPTKGQPTKLQPNSLAQIKTADRKFDVVADPKSKAWLLLDQTKRDEVAAERLNERNAMLWGTPSEDESRAALDYYEDLYAKAQAMFPGSRFTRTETEYFVFYTDLPANQVAGYVAQLDAMYHQLCVLFGVVPGTNIWVGKCAVLALNDQPEFAKFEAEVMNGAPASVRIAGLCHQYSDGKVVTVCYRLRDAATFGAMLVHETSHGFLHRIRSSGRIPPWMNEGIAEWVAGVVVPQADVIGSRLPETLPNLRQSGSLGGDFLDDAGAIQGWQYGVAVTLAQFMLSRDANAYRAMIVGIKEGYSWQDALALTYGLTPQELAALYGQAMGIPGLRP